MNLGMNTMMHNKKNYGGYNNNRGGRGGGGYRRGGGDREPKHEREKPTESKEVQSGREMAKMCNPELKHVNPEDFTVPDFARMFVIKS